MTDLISFSNNQLGFDIYKAIKKNGNLAISPASISTALMMTWLGARGDTASEMARVLHILSHNAIAAASHYADLRNGLIKRATDNKIDLSIANRIFGDSEVNFEQEFADTIKHVYNGSVDRVDFSHNAEKALAFINDRIKEDTRDKISNLLSAGSVDSSTKVVLANALYLLAPWKIAFDEQDTFIMPFGKENNPCKMMSVKDQYGYVELGNAKALQIPYSGGQMSMVIVLPNQDTELEQVEDYLDARMMMELFRRIEMSRRKLTVYLPRFTIDASPISLGNILQRLGMMTAFGPGSDFGGMTGGPTSLSNVFHKTFIKVRESGTEMAAATAVVLTRGLSRELIFRVDRPFFWSIVDHVDNLILGMGRVTQPIE